MTIDTERRACVLDTHLALSTFGLLLAQRLCSEFDLWLCRELWQILDNTNFYLSETNSLSTPLLEAGAHKGHCVRNMDAMRHVLMQWEWARSETDLAGLRVFWIGDALSESLLPSRVDEHIVQRYERLARSLERRNNSGRGDNKQTGDSFGDCFRDAAALSVALMPCRCFILTQVPSHGPETQIPEPSLCAYLRSRGIPVLPVTRERATVMQQNIITSMLDRSGVSELMWTGLDLAALHILAPRAIVLPSQEQDQATFPEPLPSFMEDGELDDWWEGALGFWYSFGSG